MEADKRTGARALIRRKRVYKGLIRWKLAVLTGLSLTTHVTIETGFRDRSYQMETLKTIAEVLDIDIVELLPLWVNRRPEDMV